METSQKTHCEFFGLVPFLQLAVQIEFGELTLSLHFPLCCHTVSPKECTQVQARLVSLLETLMSTGYALNL
jgi:hypothetical protein